MSTHTTPDDAPEATSTKLRIVEQLALAVLVAALVAFLSVALIEPLRAEDGVTFDDGICWESDGTLGLSTAWGDCMTPADYDVLFGYANLSTIPDLTDPSRSIADVAGIAPIGAASDRPRSFQGEQLPTFRQVVTAAHLPHPD